MAKCRFEQSILPHGIRAVTLSNPSLSVTVLPDKGADIYSLIHRASGVDVLWKSPQGLRAPGEGKLSSDSATAWLEMYEGGWQEILPNGGNACQYKGVELNFHGESTTLPWDFEIVEQRDDALIVDFSARLYRSPLAIRRRMSLDSTSSCVRLSEEVSNWAAEAIDLMWGHHPAYGKPFLSPDTRLETSAQSILIDDSYDPPFNILMPGAETKWPIAAAKNETVCDLSTIPAEDEQRDTLAYLLDLGDQPWYALTNPRLKLGVGTAWSRNVFSCLWLWQEVYATRGFPWYGCAYTVAVEPWSSFPGMGLEKVMKTTGTHLTLEPGAKLSSELTVALFEPAGPQPITRVELDGKVIQDSFA